MTLLEDAMLRHIWKLYGEMEMAVFNEQMDKADRIMDSIMNWEDRLDALEEKNKNELLCPK